MLRTKFQGHQSFWFLRRFLKVFTSYGCGDHIGHMTWNSFFFPPLLEALYDFFHCFPYENESLSNQI